MQRWKLARTLKITTLVVITLLVVGYGGLLGWRWWEHRLRMQTSYYGVGIGTFLVAFRIRPRTAA